MEKVIELFKKQYQKCDIYRKWCDLVGCIPQDVDCIEKIPFLPIEFFKTNKVYCADSEPVEWFESSGTTGTDTSRHFIADMQKYVDSFESGFKKFYGDPKQWSFFALLPGYLERPHSSLVVMVEGLKKYNTNRGGFFLNDFQNLKTQLDIAIENNEKIFLIGVTYAMVDFVKNYKVQLSDSSVVMETGGMKGKGREIERKELHRILKDGFGVKKIHSEYGMTELLSQAYSEGEGVFKCSDTMIVRGRDLTNPLNVYKNGQTIDNVGINIVDLSNVDSCAFIETGDRGKIFEDGKFSIHGRIEGEILRGCNMLY